MTASEVQWVLVVHAGTTLMMTGLIWFVQIVHYPLIGKVPTSHLRYYSVLHASRTTLVVAPLMLAELACAALILWLDPPGVTRGLAIAGVALLAVIWLSTALLQVPQHRAIQESADPERVPVLVKSNWIRTLSWSARALIALNML